MRVVFAAALLALVSSCGSSSDSTYGDPTPQPTTDPQWKNVIAPIVAKDCGSCHNGSVEPAFTSGAQFKASAALAKLNAGQMPPSGQIDAGDKAKLVAYLSVP